MKKRFVSSMLLLMISFYSYAENNNSTIEKETLSSHMSENKFLFFTILEHIKEYGFITGAAGAAKDKTLYVFFDVSDEKTKKIWTAKDKMPDYKFIWLPIYRKSNIIPKFYSDIILGAKDHIYAMNYSLNGNVMDLIDKEKMDKEFKEIHKKVIFNTMVKNQLKDIKVDKDIIIFSLDENSHMSFKENLIQE